MNSAAHSDTGSFRLSMLLTDKRYRSYTFQFIALIIIILAVAVLFSNLMENLRQKDLTLSYEFLGDTAGYNISQTLIPYGPQDTHLRAAFVGLLNTLLVSFLACITATIIGVIAGVLRLSKSWLISKLMSAYVEAFRNVPVLLWILIVNTVVSLWPAPRSYRGTDPENEMLFGLFAHTNRGIYVPGPELSNPIGGSPGLAWVLIVMILIGSFLGTREIASWATAEQEAKGTRPTTWYFTLAAWIVPLGIALFAMGLTWSVPSISGFNFTGGMSVERPLIALWLALSIYTGAFIAENVRAGILAINKGQTEAAAALGLRPRRIMRQVILPQALRVIIPPLISHYLNITKNSSLAIAVGYMDLTGTLGGISLNQTGRAIESVLLLMLFYLAISLTISAAMNIYNNAVRLRER